MTRSAQNPVPCNQQVQAAQQTSQPAAATQSAALGKEEGGQHVPKGLQPLEVYLDQWCSTRQPGSGSQDIIFSMSPGQSPSVYQAIKSLRPSFTEAVLAYENLFSSLHEVGLAYLDSATEQARRGQLPHKSKSVGEQTVLHLAVFCGAAATTHMLLADGADVNACVGSLRRTPLLTAILCSKPDMMAFVNMLLDAGAVVNMFEPEQLKGGSPLHVAAQQCHHPLVNTLVKAGANVNAADSQGNRLLHCIGQELAKREQDISYQAEVDIYLARLGLSPSNTSDGTVACLAAKLSECEVARALLSQGAEVNATNAEGLTPLHMAAGLQYSPKLVKMLIRAGADANVVNSKGCTPVDMVKCCHASLPQYTQYKAVLDLVSEAQGHDTTLYQVRKVLTGMRQNLAGTEYGYETCFFTHHDDGLQYLDDMIQNAVMGDRPYTTRSDMGHTLLHMAVFVDDTAAVRMLLANGADVEAVFGVWRRTPLQAAIVCAKPNMMTIVDMLLQAGAKVNCRTKETSGLHRAATRSDLHLVQALIKAGADVQAVDRRGNHPLHIVGRNTTHNLLESSYGTSCIDDEMLHLYVRVSEPACITADQIAIVQELIAAGADINAINSEGKTPLHKATWSREISVMQELLAARAAVNTADIRHVHTYVLRGDSPLHFTVNMAVLQPLLQAGADVNLKNKEGDTPLHIAARWARLPVMQALWDAGAVVDAVNCKNETPLHMAAQQSNVEAVEVLLAAGADVNAINSEGKTVLQLAAAHQPMNADIVDLLQRAGAVTCAVAVSESQDTADTAITSIAIGGAVSGAGSNETVTGPFVNGNEALERATDRLELNLEEEQTRSDDFANNCKSDDMTDSAVGNKSDTFSNGEPAKQQTGDEKQNIIDLTLDTPLQGRHKQHKSLA